MTRPIKGNLRMYPKNQVCLDCGHVYYFHTKNGCRLKYCSCTNKNHTFFQFVKNVAKFSCGRLINV